MTNWVDEVIKELAKETADYTKPEVLTKWCREMGSRLGRKGNSLYIEVWKRLRKIHKITYLDSLQKVQLLFVFQQRVNPCFQSRLLKEGHQIVLNDNTKRVVSFRSKDGQFIRCLKDKTRRFQGIPTKRSHDDRGQSPSDQEDDDGPLSESDSSLEDSTLADEPSTSGAHGEQKPIKFGGPGTPNFPVFRYSPVKEELMEDLDYEQNGASSSSRNLPEEQDQVPVDYPMDNQVEDRTRDAPRSCEQEPIVLATQRQRTESYIADYFSNRFTEHQRRNIKAFAQQIPAEVHGRATPDHETNGVQPESSETIRRYITLSEDDDIIVVPETASYSTAPGSMVKEESEIQQLALISALKLAEQIEVIAHFLNLHDLKTKAVGIVRELQLEDETICPKKFHREILSIWASVDDAKLKTYEGDSMDVKKFLESLRLSVIRPLGRKVVADSLMYIEKRIKKVDEKKSQRVLPMEKIKENLESLLALATDN